MQPLARRRCARGRAVLVHTPASPSGKAQAAWLARRYCRIVAAEVLSFMIPSQPDHEVVVSLALLHPLMRLITIYHDPSVRPARR